MINGKKILCVITARANSRGCPGKNHKELNGRPLVQWSILHAIGCEHIDLTIVSSNCPHVKQATEDLKQEIGNNYKEDMGRFYNFNEMPFGRFEFLQRPDWMASDTAKNENALLHAAVHATEDFGLKELDIIINLQPTSPVRDGGLLTKCIEQFDREGADSLFTGSKHTPFFFKKVDGDIVAEWDIQNRPMRQSINEHDFLWHDDGNVYVMDKKLLIKTHCRLGGKMSVFELTQEQSVQIDTELDFKIVEMIMKEMVR